MKKYNNIIAPNIAEERNTNNIAMMDIYSRLLEDRIVFLGEEIDEYVANSIVAQLLYLESIDSEREIYLYINSPGGSVYDGNSILDVMDIIKPQVRTVCTGLAASMAAIILSNGEKGFRSALPRSRVMIHQPSGGAWGQSTDINIAAKEIEFLKKELIQTLANNTGQDIEKINIDMERDKWLSPQDCIDYGIIDEIVEIRKIK